MDVREKLVDMIFISFCRHIDKSYKLAKNIAEDLISNGVTAQEWIPVAKTLPDVGVEVLVYSEIVGICVDYYDGDAFGYFDVTHWMPLPQPPKGE